VTGIADAWVPVPLRWRHVQVGDVFFSAKTGDLWLVTAAENRADRPARRVTVAHGGATHTAEVELDDIAQVLVPVIERDALRLSRDELGARLIDRRTRPL
jgi:hypothetical protein